MSKGPPLRLRDDPTAGRALREDLARASAGAFAGYDVAAGLAKFEKTVGAGGPGRGGGAATAGGKTLLGAALKGALLGVAALGGAAVIGDRSPTPVSTLAAPVASAVAPAKLAGEVRSTPPPVAVAEPPPTPRSLETTRPRVVDLPAPSGAGSASSTEPAPPPEPPAVVVAPAATPAPEGDPLAAEMAQLARARVAQDRDPAAALALTEEGSRLFPRGLFAQEREAIAIVALFRIGRVPEGRARGQAFLAAYPRSSFAERVGKLTAGGATLHR